MLGCRCAEIEARHEAHLDASYMRGYDACLADGYGAHPLWALFPAHEGEAACDYDWLRLVLGHAIRGVDGERFYLSAWRGPCGIHRDPLSRFVYNPLPWPSTLYPSRPHPASYLDGWEDAGVGLPCAVRDQERHAVQAAALDAYDPGFALVEPERGEPLYQSTYSAEGDGLPF